MNLRIDAPANNIVVRLGDAQHDGPEANESSSASAPTAAAESQTSQRVVAPQRDADQQQGRHDPGSNPGNEVETIFRQHVAARLQADASGSNTQGAARFVAQQVASHATTAPATLLWTDYSVYLIGHAGQREGALSALQLRQHGELAHLLMSLAPSGSTRALNLAPDGLATLAQAAGIGHRVLDLAQLAAATRYINAAPNLLQQQQLVAQTLTVLQTLDAPKPPQLSVQEMKDQLRATLGIPEKAFKKMSEAEVRAKYQELMAAMTGPAGSHQFKVGKYKVGFSVDGNGNVTECKVKKKGFFGRMFSGIGHFLGKFGKILLTVCSFIPIPWISIPARIISGVIAVVEGIKNKNILQAVAGAASAVVGGVGAIAGKALTGTAAVVSKVATTVGKAARGLQAGIDAVKSKNLMGVVNAGLSVAGSVAGAFGASAEAIANTADKVHEWANNVLVGEQVLVSIKNGHFVQAATDAAGLVAGVASQVKGGENVERVAGQVQTYAGYLRDADKVVGDLRGGDIAGAFNAAASLANGIDTAFGAGHEEGSDTKVAQYLNYAGSAVEVGTSLARGKYNTAFEQTGQLLDRVVSQQFKPGSSDGDTGWAATAHRWLDNGGKIVGIVDDIRHGRIDKVFDAAPGIVNDIAWDFGHVIGAVPQDSGATRDSWQVKQQIQVWSGRGEQAWTIANDIGNGKYADAAHHAVALGADIAGNPDAGWTRTANRLIDYSDSAVRIGGNLAHNQIDAALDNAAVLVNRIDADWAHGDAKPGEVNVLQQISVWAGRGADAYRIYGHVRAKDYEGASLQGLELGVDIAGGTGTSWGQDVREKGGRVIETGFDVGRAIGHHDVLEILRTATELADAVREVTHRHGDRAQKLAA